MTLLAFLVLTCAAGRARPLWIIGSPDRDNAEFSLAPGDYEQFTRDGFFVVGLSDPQTAWPYVHPGPSDVWAGGRPHMFSVLFGVGKTASEGTCRLVLDLLDTHYSAAPELRIEVNGQRFDRKLNPGASDASINANSKAGKPCRVEVEFPAALLRQGNNRITVTSVSGSWFLYDSVALETPDVITQAKVADVTDLVSARCLPAIVQRNGKSYQHLAASIVHIGPPREVTVRLAENELQRLQLKEGQQTFKFLVPAVKKASETVLALHHGQQLISSKDITLTPGLKEIVVVFKTHFDIGYTDMASNIVQRYRTSMIDQALDVADQNRDLPPQQQFAWTLAGWPMHKILEDWPGQSSFRKERIENAIAEGRFVVHGLPFSTHTELLEVEDLVRSLGYSARLASRLGLSLPRDAKMTDVPEHTWMMATLLKHAGMDFMMIGCNGVSAPLQVPWLFWWQGPDGSRVLTFYSPDYGTKLVPPPDWPYSTWLACLHTGDNHGPPRPEEVKQVLDQAANRFPGVKVRIGRLSDFGDAILAEKPDLPVIRADAPDTWIHGPMSDPAGAKLARNTRPLIAAAEGLNTQLRQWGAPVTDDAPSIAAAYEQSLLYGEHTWGGAIYWVGNTLSYGDAFQKDLAQGRYKRLEGSWEEHTAYIEKAHQLIAPVVANNLMALARSVSTAEGRVVVYNPLPWKRGGVVNLDVNGFAPKGLKPVDGGPAVRVHNLEGRLQFFATDIPPMGYRSYIAANLDEPGAASISVGDLGRAALESPFFSAKLDPARGIVASLVDKRSGRELAGTTGGYGLGQYLYERFDKNQVMDWCAKYVHGHLYPDFQKPELPSADIHPYHAESPKNFKLRFEENAASLDAVMESEATRDLPAVTLRLILSREQPCADLEITLHDKPFESWPEAGWLCLPLNVSEPQFRLGRLASIIDPAQDVITGANRHLFGLNTGFVMTNERGRGVGVCPIDYPLVSLDEPGCWRYSLDYVPKKPVGFVNLFNNQWSTNFRLWNRGTWTSRVRLWAIDRYAAEASLVTPSVEARNPLIAAFAEGGAGTLPPARRGLEISRKGIIVTAFGSNPYGPGTVLRLWEYAGQSGAVKVRLPEGINVRQVQPVDLRGRPAGKPLPVKSDSFKLNIQAFAPASFSWVE